MKIKFLAIFILTILVLVGCSSAVAEKANGKNEATKTSQTTETKVENKVKETKTETEKPKEISESNNISRKAVSGKEVTGTFQLKFKNEGLDGTNEVKIEALGNNKLMVEFDLIYPFQSGGANIGKAQGEAIIETDTAIYSTKDDKGSCEIKIKFVKEGLIKVTQKQTGNGCGFGLNVFADGVYKKVSGEKPTFSPQN